MFTATGGNCWMDSDGAYLGPAPSDDFKCDLYNQAVKRNTIEMFMVGLADDKKIVKVMVKNYDKNNVFIYSESHDKTYRVDRDGFYKYFPTYNDAANFLWHSYKRHIVEMENRIEKLFSELRKDRALEKDLKEWLKTHDASNIHINE